MSQPQRSVKRSSEGYYENSDGTAVDLEDVLVGSQVVSMEYQGEWLVIELNNRFKIHFWARVGVVIVHPDPGEVS